MPSSYLHTCLDRFEKVSKERYGRPFKLAAIENDVQHLRSKRKITSGDLVYFTNPERWWFDRFWVLPASTQIDGLLEKAAFDFHQLSRGNEGSRKESQTIETLLEVFRSIELVSIMLRFVRPESFGIISPPVEQVLCARRGFDASETYLHYLADLRAIRDHYQFKRAADADMALWVVHYLCFSGKPLDPAIHRAFNNDGFMLQLRTKNLVAPLSSIPLSRLAIAFQSARDDLAALIGAYALEASIRDRALRLGMVLSSKDSRGRTIDLDLADVINAMRDCRHIDSLKAAKWHRLRLIRNKIVHGKLTVPLAADLRELVQEILSLEENTVLTSYAEERNV